MTDKRFNRKKKIKALINDPYYQPMKQREIGYLMQVAPEDRDAFFAVHAAQRTFRMFRRCSDVFYPCCTLLPVAAFIFADTSLHAARNHYSTGDAKSIRIARHLTHTVLPDVSL